MTTIDNDTAQRIRTLLEPHGYRHDYGYWRLNLPRTPEQELVHFLNDKAQTGARIRDIRDSWLWVGGIYHDGERKHDMAFGIWTYDDPDEAIAALWLKVHDLEDPRKQVPA